MDFQIKQGFEYRGDDFWDWWIWIEGAEEALDQIQGGERMVAEVPTAAEKDPSLGKHYWYVVTLAEIHFGLQNYDEAGQWRARAAILDAREWEKQTTFKQLVSLARLQGVEAPAAGSNRSTWHPAWKALSALLGEDTERALFCFPGKVGLALSGGGFRASFFHLGVMARLAELDALRGVEVLSTVSGGSILGAHYYLEVQRLLESKPDPAITRQDYIDIAGACRSDFWRACKRISACVLSPTSWIISARYSPRPIPAATVWASFMSRSYTPASKMGGPPVPGPCRSYWCSPRRKRRLRHSRLNSPTSGGWPGCRCCLSTRPR